MRKETDLRQVKATARAMLMLDIDETDFSPIIVKHPFTDSGITAIPKPNGGIQMLTLMDNPSDLKRWRDFVSQTIEKAKSAYEIYMMVTKPYGLTFLKFVYPNLSQGDMSNILSSAWTRAEAPNRDVNVSKAKLLAMFKAADPASLMDEEELKRFQELEDTVTVYRGVTSLNADNVKALSWTLDQETAEWFAHRFGEDGTVYEAQISKEHIYAYFGGRNEAEVIVDPKHLMDITEVQDIDNGFQMTM